MHSGHQPSPTSDFYLNRTGHCYQEDDLCSSASSSSLRSVLAYLLLTNLSTYPSSSNLLTDSLPQHKSGIGRLGYPLQKKLLKSQWSDLALSTAFCLHIVSLHSKSTARSKTTTPCTVSIWIQTPHQRSDPPSSSITDLWTFTRN